MLKGYNLAFMPINYSKKFVQFAHRLASSSCSLLMSIATTFPCSWQVDHHLISQVT